MTFLVRLPDQAGSVLNHLGKKPLSIPSGLRLHDCGLIRRNLLRGAFEIVTIFWRNARQTLVAILDVGRQAPVIRAYAVFCKLGRIEAMDGYETGLQTGVGFYPMFARALLRCIRNDAAEQIAERAPPIHT